MNYHRISVFKGQTCFWVQVVHCWTAPAGEGNLVFPFVVQWDDVDSVHYNF